MISLIAFVLNAKFIIGFLLGGAAMFIYKNWKKAKQEDEMWAWLVGLLVPAAKHAILRTISVICVLAVIGGLVWAIYVAFIRPTTKPNPTTTVQSGGVANTYNVKVGLGGCARFSPITKK